MSLAVYSRDLKVFTSEDDYSTPVSISFTTSDPSQGKITWSGDGKWLSVAPLDQGNGPLPIFKYSNKQLQPLKYITLPNISSASFFNWTNRNIIVGNENGEIFIWDIKDKKISTKVECVERQPIDIIAINSEDAYLASGSLTTDKVSLHSLKTNKVINTICIPKSRQTTSLKFCMCKKNYLGASSLESTICVWDIMRSEFIFKNIHAHAGACMDMSFSPINFDIIASVSLTKTLKMYDLRERKLILDVNIGEPLNCVDITSSGDKVALGTTGGSVIMYDLRSDRVLQSFKVCSGPVISLKTQNLKTTKLYNEVEMNTPDTIENPSKTLDISVMDVFSPIIKNNSKEISSSLLNHSKVVSFHSTPNMAANNNEITTPCDDSFFKKVLSPLPQQMNLFITSTSQSSPCLSSISEKPDSEPENSQENISKSTQKRLSELTKGDGEGDGFHVNNSSERNLYYSDLVGEIKTCKKEILNEINVLKKEINEMKTTFNGKFKILEENYISIKKLLLDEIKPEIFAGNCNSKIEQTTQRILINELNELFLTNEEKIREGIQLNAFRLMHIYNILKGAK